MYLVRVVPDTPLSDMNQVSWDISVVSIFIRSVCSCPCLVFSWM